MRDLTSAQRATLGAQRFHIFGKCRVANEDGTMITVPHFVTSAWSLDIDNLVSGGTVEFSRGRGTDSIAPLITSSVWNVNDALEYSPLLDGNRLIELWAACVNPGVSPVWTPSAPAAPYRKVFVGRIDDADPTQNDRVVCAVRDLGARLVDKPIEVTREYPEMPVEDLIQSVIDDNAPAGPAITLVTRSFAGWPNWTVRRHELKRGVMLLEALNKYAEQAAGVVRYGFDGEEPALLFYKPDRAKTAADFTITVNERIKIDELRPNFTNIRNAIRVTYIDRATGEQRWVIKENPASIDKYDRQYAEVPEDEASNIDSPTEANDYAQAIVDDLSFPEATHRARVLFFYPAELSDLGGWQADNFTHSDDQTFGVVNVNHSLQPADGRTDLTSRGKIAGQYDRWLRKLRRSGEPPGPPVAPSFSKLYAEQAGFGGDTGDGYVWMFAKFNKSTKYIRITAEEGDDVESTPMPDLGTNSTCIELFRQDSTTSRADEWESLIPIATRPGRTRRIRAIGVDPQGNTSPDYVPEAIRAVDPSPKPMYGVINGVSIVAGALGIDNYITVDIGDIEPTMTETGSLLCIMRDKVVLETIQLGTNGNRSMTIIDPGLTNPNATHTYEVFIWNNGVSGRKWSANFGEPPVVDDTKPIFINNTPRGVILGGGVQKVQIEGQTSFPGATGLVAIASVDGWRTTRTLGSPQPIGGALFFDSDMFPKLYKLVAVDASLNVLAFSDEVFYRGSPNAPGGGSRGSTIAPVFTLRTGTTSTLPRIPALFGDWTCDNPDASYIEIEMSDDNGATDPWVALPNSISTDVLAGSCPLLSFSTQKWYRAVAHNNVGLPISISLPQQWQGFQT